MAKREHPEPDFVSKKDLARHYSASTQSIDNWIADGSHPPPFVRIGRAHTLWRSDHYRVFLETGHWPPDAWGNHPGRPKSDGGK